MKKIHIRKPDIKGLSVKVRNLKFKDIKEHYKARKERRQKILEERRNSKFAKKMQPVYKWMNRLSLPLQYLLACVINFFIEVISRHSLFQAWNYMTGTPLVFLFNAFLIFATFMIVYLFKRRVFVRILLSVFWLFLGTCNGYLLLKRVTPFNAQDLKVLSDALELTSNYFNALNRNAFGRNCSGDPLDYFHVETWRTVYRKDAPPACGCRDCSRNYGLYGTYQCSD